MGEREFPIMARHGVPGCPASVPWSIVAPHDEQAQRNHNQTLEQLARRGGLSPGELAAVLRGEDLRFAMRVTNVEAVNIINAVLRPPKRPTVLTMDGETGEDVIEPAPLWLLHGIGPRIWERDDMCPAPTPRAKL